MKKFFLFFFIGSVSFLLTLFYFHLKQKEFENYLKQVSKIKSEIEKTKLLQTNKSQINSWSTEEDKEKILEQMVAKQLADIDEILNLQEKNTKSPYKVIYQKLYASSMKRNNLHAAIKAVKRLLPYTENKDIWLKTLVDLEIKVGNFKEAEKHAQKLIELYPTKENLKKYFYILLQNTNFFDESQVNKIKQVIDVLYKKWYFGADDLSFYNFLISLLSNWDIKKIKDELPRLITDLKNDQYKVILKSFLKDLQIYETSRGSPKYYFQALVALDLLKFWYFWIAKNIAEQVYIQDSSYILPLQILAYSYFYIWNYQQAIKYFEKLKQEDQSSQNDYNFFLWVSYYWLNDYVKALLLLDLVKQDSPYYLDALRYRLLSYFAIKDKENAIKTIEKMLKYKLSYVDYYNIFKYLLFRCKDCYKKNTRLIISLIKSCYKDVDEQYQYVCWYWKWNLFLKAWKKDLAVKYFKLLTDYFQDPYIRNTLATYYEKKWDYRKARFYYLRELLYTSKEEKRKKIKEKIKELFLKKEAELDKN